MALDWILGAFGGVKDDSVTILDRLAKYKAPVEVEIENSQVRFKSQLNLRNSAVVFAKPLALSIQMHRGDHIRIRWPGTGRREMRLEVAIPHFNLPNGNVGFACKSPQGAKVPQRRHERFDVRRYSNLRLALASQDYRLMDLSVTGCRIHIAAEPQLRQIALGRPVEGATLFVGEAAQVSFEQLIARSKRNTLVGCEFLVKQDRTSPRALTDLLKALERGQLELSNGN